MFSSLFWKDFFERLLATLAQVALGLLGAEGVSHVHPEAWAATLVVAGLAVFVKVCAAAGIVPDGVSPGSFAKAAPDQPAVDAEEAHKHGL